jgi:hypothetical protein
VAAIVAESLADYSNDHLMLEGGDHDEDEMEIDDREELGLDGD